MGYTVYTMGDMPIFENVLNAMTAVFNSSLFDPAQGGGVFVVGLLTGILFAAIQTAISGRFSAINILMIFVLYWGGIVPRETLQIEDIYSGTISAVDNVPEIVALPASLIATLTHAITQDVETAFQSTSGTNYQTLGTGGFVDPLQTLLKLQDPLRFTSSEGGSYLSESITEFIRFCAPTDPTYNQATMLNSADAMGYLSALPVTGVAYYWSNTYPLGEKVSCQQLASNIRLDTSFSIGQAGGTVAGLDVINAVLKQPVYGDTSSNPNSQSDTTTGVDNAYNSILGGITGLAQNSQQFMVNVLMRVPVSSAITCNNTAGSMQDDSCLEQSTETQMRERKAAADAANAGMFVRTAVPAMNVLLALFYGFSPIILAAAIIAGPHTVKMLAGYIMFGAWTQSWMPIAAVINYMIQVQIQEAAAQLGTNGVTMANWASFYQLLEMKLSVANSLLASTPMLTMALLSGSVYGLTKVASGFDYSGSKTVSDDLSPELMKNGALVSNGSRLSTIGVTQDQVTGEHAGTADPMKNVQLSTKQSQQAVHSEGQAQVHSSLHTLMDGYKKATQDVMNNTDQNSHAHEAAEGLQDTYSTSHDIATKMSDLVMHTRGIKDSEAMSINNQIISGLKGFRTDGGKSLQSALQRAESEIKGASGGSDQITEGLDIGDSHNSNSEAAAGLVQSYDHKVTNSDTWKNAYSHMDAFNHSEMAGRDFSNMDSSVNGKQRSIQNLISTANAVDQGWSGTARDLGMNAKLQNFTPTTLRQAAYDYGAKHGISRERMDASIAAMEKMKHASIGFDKQMSHTDEMEAIAAGVMGVGNGMEFAIDNHLAPGADGEYQGYRSAHDGTAKELSAPIGRQVHDTTRAHPVKTEGDIPTGDHGGPDLGMSRMKTDFMTKFNQDRQLWGGTAREGQQKLDDTEKKGTLGIAENMMHDHPESVALTAMTSVANDLIGQGVGRKLGGSIEEWAKSHKGAWSKVLQDTPALRSFAGKAMGAFGLADAVTDGIMTGHVSRDDMIEGASSGLMMTGVPVLEATGVAMELIQAGSGWASDYYTNKDLAHNNEEEVAFSRNLSLTGNKELRHQVLSDVVKHGPQEMNRFNKFIADGGTAEQFLATRGHENGAPRAQAQLSTVHVGDAAHVDQAHVRSGEARPVEVAGGPSVAEPTVRHDSGTVHVGDTGPADQTLMRGNAANTARKAHAPDKKVSYTQIATDDSASNRALPASAMPSMPTRGRSGTQ